MKTMLAVLLAVGLFTVVGAQSKSATCTLKVTGMTCAGCEAAVKIAAKKIDGVTDIVVSYDKSAADVTYDPAKTTPATIAKVITDKTGYKAVPQPKK
jgi:copper chaperone CopZ